MTVCLERCDFDFSFGEEEIHCTAAMIRKESAKLRQLKSSILLLKSIIEYSNMLSVRNSLSEKENQFQEISQVELN